MTNLLRNDDLGKLLLRLAVGLLMLFHGVAKLLDPGSLKYIAGQLGGIGLPGFLAYGVFLGEVVGPLLAIAGFHARIGGLLMAVNMLFAIVLVHTGELFMLTRHGGWALELQGLYLFGALAIVFLGSGGMALKRD